MSGNRRNFIENLLLSSVLLILFIVFYMIFSGSGLKFDIDLSKYTTTISKQFKTIFQDTRILSTQQDANDTNSTTVTTQTEQ